MENQTKVEINCPEMAYFMSESESDVVFVIDGQKVPALKLILKLKSKVFRAMFSESFKESKDKEVVIEDTTFEAFKTFIQFLYCDELVLPEDYDFELIRKLCQLGDRYDVRKMFSKVGELLMSEPLRARNLEPISSIADNYKIENLMAFVLTYIENNFNNFVTKDIKVITESNDSFHSKLLDVMAKNYNQLNLKLNSDFVKVRNEFLMVKKELDQTKMSLLSSKCNAKHEILCQGCKTINHYHKMLPNYCGYCQRQIKVKSLPVINDVSKMFQ